MRRISEDYSILLGNKSLFQKKYIKTYITSKPKWISYKYSFVWNSGFYRNLYKKLQMNNFLNA